jgi:hypothetical protein
MIDPMAGLDDGPGMASEENTKEVFDSMTLQRNLQRVDKIRSVMGIASGCAAGIVGFTGLEGFGTSRSIVLLYVYLLCVSMIFCLSRHTTFAQLELCFIILKYFFYFISFLQLAFYCFILRCRCFFGHSN